MLFYNICLFITKDKNVNFDIIGFQTNNILNIEIEIFINKKIIKIIKANFKAKSQIMLEIDK